MGGKKKSSRWRGGTSKGEVKRICEEEEEEKEGGEEKEEEVVEEVFPTSREPQWNLQLQTRIIPSLSPERSV